MFNLESAIADWRQKMLAAGIETPVPLEELEEHLREEIERQQHAGLAASQAFEIAVQHIGGAHALKVEFRKAGEKKAYRPNRIYDAVLALYALCSAAMISLPQSGRGVQYLLPTRGIPSLIALNFFYVAAMAATLYVRINRPKSARRVTNILNWALLPCFPVGSFICLYGLLSDEIAKAEGAHRSSSWKLFTFARTTVSDQNPIKNFLDALFRIFCGLFVGLIGGCGMLLFAADQLTSMDFGLIYADGAFSPYRLMVGPAASLILGVAGLICGILMLWCAWQMIRRHKTHPKMTSVHV